MTHAHSGNGMYTLGVSCFFHDSAASLLCDGELVAAAEEERFTRIKHDYGYPRHAIDFCLRQAGISGKDLDLVVFFEKPFIKLERILTTAMVGFPGTRSIFDASMRNWFGQKLWIRSELACHLGIPPSRIIFSEHHVSHAASAFFCSAFNEAAFLTVDGVGEWATATFGVGRGTELSILGEMRFPHSLGLLYSAFTAFLGFEVNEGEYKVMGMAPFGKPRYVDKVLKLLDLSDDGSFHLKMEYFSFHRSSQETFSSRFVDLFGPPRPRGLDFFTPSTGFYSYFGKRPPDFTERAQLNEHYADVAASIQAVTEEILLSMAKYLRKRTGLTRLCMAGGVALNSVANSRILRESGFEEIFVQPAAGDGGGALGAALWGYHQVSGNPRKFQMRHAYWGEEHSEAAIVEFLRSAGVSHAVFDDQETLLDHTVCALMSGAVIGWTQGRFEFGPRALGNRSILADPRRDDMKDIVNTKIKFREPFRPFAPAVLAERFSVFFEPAMASQVPARFMLLVSNVQSEKRGTIPAVTHVDGTGRAQAVFAEESPTFHKLISRFAIATGVPVLLNTSFNLRGEPIVNTPKEALDTFMRSGMDFLVLGNTVINKSNVAVGT
jgi:carbamoyltransferase